MFKKNFLILMIVNFALAGIFAQDDEWGDSTENTESVAENSGDDWSDGSDWGDDSSSTSGGGEAGGFWSKFKISGDATIAARYYIDTGADVEDTPVKAIPEFELGLEYEGESTNFNAQINLSERTLLHNKMDILDEFHADLFLGNFVLSAGKMKIVWGKGDKLHVLDNFNANDYTDFLMPDYLDRRAGEYMFRVQYNAPQGFRLEGVYTPVMRGEIYAEEGLWVPYKAQNLKGIVTQSISKNILANIGNPATYLGLLMEASSISADDIYPDTNKLKYGQFGAYANFTVGMLDFGISYYNGHYKQVSANLLPVMFGRMPELNYDKLHVFGLDAQTALGPFTLRAEVCYNLTNDFAGSDPWIHNHSVSHLVGFDIGLPIHNLNLNVQETGNFVLNKGKIDDMDNLYFFFAQAHVDTDYDPTGWYHNNKLVVQLKDTFYYEKIEALVKTIYGFERQDLIVMPEVSYKIRDGWKAKLSGLVIHNFREDESKSEFYGWLDNSFIQFSVNYTF